MARPREFDAELALDAAISVFREHGYEGTSAQMLVDAMGIGRQSLYAAFGDKWQLYCSAARRYGMGECAVHFDALRSGPRAIDGIYAMLRRVVETADQPCLGVSSIYEFGASRPDLKEINALLARSLRNYRRPHRVHSASEVAAGLRPRRDRRVSDREHRRHPRRRTRRRRPRDSGQPGRHGAKGAAIAHFYRLMERSFNIGASE
jgi:AcrR family transcriptional regulator